MGWLRESRNRGASPERPWSGHLGAVGLVSLVLALSGCGRHDVLAPKVEPDPAGSGKGVEAPGGERRRFSSSIDGAPACLTPGGGRHGECAAPGCDG